MAAVGACYCVPVILTLGLKIFCGKISEFTSMLIVAEPVVMIMPTSVLAGVLPGAGAVDTVVRHFHRLLGKNYETCRSTACLLLWPGHQGSAQMLDACHEISIPGVWTANNL